jgi:hypothetical protein
MMRRLRRRFWSYVALAVLLLLALKAPVTRFLADAVGAVLSAAGYLLSELASLL